MKLITRDTDYALRAVCFIAKRSPEVVDVSTLVEKIKIPRPFLRKLLQVLSRKGILKSYKGAGGGFVLVQAPQKIFLTGLIRTFQGPLKLNECFFKKLSCPNKKTCVLRKKIRAIERYVVKELNAISVASLLQNK